MAKDYNAKDVAVNVGGQLLSGFADGEVIKITPNKERAILKVGVDGEGGRAKQNDKSAKITLILLQTSASNDVLSAYSKSQMKFSFGLKDLNGTSIAVAPECWIKDEPEVAFAGEIGNREWVLETDAIDQVIGGAF